MPTFVTLTQEEITNLAQRRNDPETLRPYTEYIGTLKPGDWGAIDLAPTDHKRTVKRRMSIAATTYGMRARWRRTSEPGLVLVFTLEKKVG